MSRRTRRGRRGRLGGQARQLGQPHPTEDVGAHVRLGLGPQRRNWCRLGVGCVAAVVGILDLLAQLSLDVSLDAREGVGRLIAEGGPLGPRGSVLSCQCWPSRGGGGGGRGRLRLSLGVSDGGPLHGHLLEVLVQSLGGVNLGGIVIQDESSVPPALPRRVVPGQPTQDHAGFCNPKLPLSTSALQSLVPLDALFVQHGTGHAGLVPPPILHAAGGAHVLQPPIGPLLPEYHRQLGVHTIGGDPTAVECPHGLDGQQYVLLYDLAVLGRVPGVLLLLGGVGGARQCDLALDLGVEADAEALPSRARLTAAA
mmetsp:Transcript_39823/g.73460  ORF Transcript_39823/g.73460 Transcript_39823/m.73460 type:complete len:311 (+) Transcript_39823:318-1250(+)